MNNRLARNSSLALGKGGAINHTENQAVAGTGVTVDYIAGTIFAMHFLTETTPTVLNTSNGQSFAGMTFQPGDIVYLNVTALACTTTEEVILYQG